jgi:hypothetical protein
VLDRAGGEPDRTRVPRAAVVLPPTMRTGVVSMFSMLVFIVIIPSRGVVGGELSEKM